LKSLPRKKKTTTTAVFYATAAAAAALLNSATYSSATMSTGEIAVGLNKGHKVNSLKPKKKVACRKGHLNKRVKLI
jgi:hypothetical protein